MPKHDPELATLIDRLVSGYRDLTEQSARLARDATKTEGAELVALAKTAKTKIVPLVDSLDTTSSAVAQRVTSLQAKIASTYNPANKNFETVQRQIEIRAYFRQLGSTEKLRALEAAKEARDEDTILALVSAQPYLSGLPPPMHEQARSQIVEVKAPVEAAAVVSLAEQQALVEIFRSELLQSCSDLIGFPRAAEIIAAAQDDAAA